MVVVVVAVVAVVAAAIVVFILLVVMVVVVVVVGVEVVKELIVVIEQIIFLNLAVLALLPILFILQLENYPSILLFGQRHFLDLPSHLSLLSLLTYEVTFVLILFFITILTF